MSAHCLLISANKMASPYPVYPIGIAHLTGALLAEGHTVRHVDILADGNTEGLQTLLSQETFDIIGISIRNIDTVDSSNAIGLLDHIEEVVEIIRTLCQTPIILGGPGFSIMPGIIVKNTIGKKYISCLMLTA